MCAVAMAEAGRLGISCDNVLYSRPQTGLQHRLAALSLYLKPRLLVPPWTYVVSPTRESVICWRYTESPTGQSVL